METKLRQEGERFTLPYEDVAQNSGAILSELDNKILANVVKVDLSEKNV